MADKELTGRELKQNLTQAKKDAEAIAKSSKSIKDSLVEAAKALAGFGGARAGFVASGPASYKGGGGGGGGFGSGGSMPNQSNMQNSLYRPGVGLTDFTNFAAGMSKGFMNFLPEVGSTIQRAGTYYNATIMGGYRGAQRISRGEVENTTYGTLAEMGGITSAGSSANVANIFANQGMVAGSSTYKQNVRAVGNAARYLNMSNESAAAAIGGLGTGAMSANLMRNFGIYTSDPNTGQERSMADVFEDLASRLSRPGTTATAEDVQNSIRKGALGAAISASGLSQEQQQLFKQYMIERAGGNKMDLSDQSQMKKLIDAQNLPGPGSGIMAMNDNPLNALMDLETSAEGAEKAATPAYIAGIKAATIQLKGLDLIAGTLARTLGVVTSSLQTTLGARTTQGLLGMAGAGINLASSGVQAMLDADPTGISKAAAGGVALGVGAAGAKMATDMSTFASVLGLFGGSGANAGSGPGSGDKAMEASSLSDILKTADKNVRAGGGSTSVGKPIEGGKILTNFGEATSFEGEKIPFHDGIDYVAKLGTPVRAVADGKVVKLVKGRPPHKTGADTGNTWGNYVKILHDSVNGKTQHTVYSHLQDVYVDQNQEVKKGDVIGTLGKSGKASGPHLHFEYLLDGKATDPKNFKTTGKKSEPLYNASQIQSAISMTQAIQSLFSGDISTGLSKLGSLLNISTGGSTYGTSGSSPATGTGNTSTGGTAPTAGGGNVTNNVGGITVNIKEATPESAKQFADYVKDYLENQTLTSNLGSY